MPHRFHLHQFIMAFMGILTLLALCLPTFAQEQPPYIINIEVESALIRTYPADDAPLAASAFEDQKLEAVGRNLDGRWLEVRRTGRLNSLGWIFVDIISFDFRIERLPLTDLRTGLLGPVPLAADPGFAAFINESVVLRTKPFYEGDRILGLPYGVTVPVLERDSTSEWLRVNYLGYEGWIIAFTTRRMVNLTQVPVSALSSVRQINALIIPPEVQRAQLQRVRDYIQPRLELAINLEGFWQQVNRGELMPCSPPAFAIPLEYTTNDVRELPEIARHAPRINEATIYLNQAIEPLQRCGALPPKTVIEARNGATNARIIYEATLKALELTEEQIR